MKRNYSLFKSLILFSDGSYSIDHLDNFNDIHYYKKIRIFEMSIKKDLSKDKIKKEKSNEIRKLKKNFFYDTVR